MGMQVRLPPRLYPFFKRPIMKLRFLIFLILPLCSFAQLGIGTSNPHASAMLEISSTDKGFLFPRVSLQGTDDATKSTPTIPSPATGLMVYNQVIAGTGATAVSPGVYYFDGNRWQRVLNQQPDVTVEFNTADPNTGSPTFTPNTPASRDVLYISSVDASQWTYNGTAYVTYTPPASTAWSTQSSSTDAGSSKTNGIYRTGSVGIGTGVMAPSTKMDVRASSSGTGFRLVDGTQAANKILQSDASGNASWTNPTTIPATVLGTMGVGGQNTGDNAYTGASITLPPGKWSVQISMLVFTGSFDGITRSAGNYWIRTGFSTNSSSNSVNNSIGLDAIGPTLVSGYIYGGQRLNMIRGTIILNNTSGANKTYYYFTYNTTIYDGGAAPSYINLGRDQAGENSIIAYPMN